MYRCTVGIKTMCIPQTMTGLSTHFVIPESARTCFTTTGTLPRSNITWTAENISGTGSTRERMGIVANDSERVYSHRTPCGRRNHCDSLGHPPARPEQGQADGLSSHLRQQPASNLSCVQS